MTTFNDDDEGDDEEDDDDDNELDDSSRTVGSLFEVRSTPANSRKVGKKSRTEAGAKEVEPAGITPGHQTRHGTRTPPSQVEP